MTNALPLVEQARAAGERITPQRQMVMHVLEESGDHLSLQDIRQSVQDAYTTDLADPTIYRILQWLKNLGFIAQTDMAERGVVYQVIDNPPHHHLICLNCNRVIDIEDTLLADLREALRDRYAFHARMDHMAIYGLCEDCESADERA